MKKLSPDTSGCLTIVLVATGALAVAALSAWLDIDITDPSFPWIVIGICVAAALGSLIIVVLAFRRVARLDRDLAEEKRDVAKQVDRMFAEAVIAAKYHLERAQRLQRGLDDQHDHETHLGVAATRIDDIIARLHVPEMETDLVAVKAFSRYTTRFIYERTPDGK